MKNEVVVTEKECPIEPIWILKNSLSTILLVFILLVPFLSSQSTESKIKLLYYSLFVTFMAFCHFVLNLLRRTRFKFSLNEKYLELAQGIVSKQNRHIPYGAIQNVIVKRGIFDRVFGLATVRIENAASSGGAFVPVSTNLEPIGFEGNAVSIPGLYYKNAELLKIKILEKIKNNPTKELGI